MLVLNLLFHADVSGIKSTGLIKGSKICLKKLFLYVNFLEIAPYRLLIESLMQYLKKK